MTAGAPDDDRVAGAPAVGASGGEVPELDVAALLDAIAREPRPAGGDAESRARAHCTALLEARGWRTRELPFEYSALPGRWGTPIGGVASILLLGSVAEIGARGHAVAALLLLASGGVLLALAARWLARRGVLDLRALRATGVNLESTRDGRGAPGVWLVAHLDSKSQPVPIGLRALGVTLSLVAWGAALALVAMQLQVRWEGLPWPTLWGVVGVLAIVGGLPVAATTVGSRSPGALDNASGVAAVLRAADLLARSRRVPDVGVLITSAEELGLAGARAWVRHRHARGGARAPVLNCDGVDDAGTMLCMHSGAHPPGELAHALFDAAEELEENGPRMRRILPGILTDGVAFSDAGWDAVTLSRGTLRTLARIHSARDRRDALDGEGIERVAAVLAAAAARLADSGPRAPRRETGARASRSDRVG